VQQGRSGGRGLGDERGGGPLEQFAIKIALLESGGVITKEIDGGDDLHRSILAYYHVTMLEQPGAEAPNHETRVADLVATIASLDGRELTEQFLRDLCTRAELEAMAQRWEVAQLVSQGVSYLQIAQRTGASTATVTRVAQWVRHGTGGYAAVLEASSS
jgi:TrpR-related protein YerC/YecD